MLPKMHNVCTFPMFKLEMTDRMASHSEYGHVTIILIHDPTMYL